MPHPDDIIEDLIDKGFLKTPAIIEAFRQIRRKDFLPAQQSNLAYLDMPLPIGFEQTNSQPSTVAFMLELLQPQNGDTVLDIGSGSGWTTALLAYLVGPNGLVLGLEVIPELVNFGNHNLSKYDFRNAKIELAGEKVGKPGMVFDRILVSASAPSYPEILVDQLRVGGTLVIPVGYSIFLTKRTSPKNYRNKEYPGFVFVPLV